MWPLVLEAFAGYLTTTSARRLAGELATRHGIEISPATLRRVLTDPIYLDGRHLQMVGGKSYVAAPVRLGNPVPQALFDAVAAEMARRRR